MFQGQYAILLYEQDTNDEEKTRQITQKIEHYYSNFPIPFFKEASAFILNAGSSFIHVHKTLSFMLDSLKKNMKDEKHLKEWQNEDNCTVELLSRIEESLFYVFELKDINNMRLSSIVFGNFIEILKKRADLYKILRVMEEKIFEMELTEEQLYGIMMLLYELVNTDIHNFFNSDSFFYDQQILIIVSIIRYILEGASHSINIIKETLNCYYMAVPLLFKYFWRMNECRELVNPLLQLDFGTYFDKIYKIFSKIVMCHYVSIQYFIQNIFLLTIDNMQNYKIPGCQMCALHFWKAIAKSERKVLKSEPSLSNNFVLGAISVIKPIIYALINKRDLDKMDEDLEYIDEEAFKLLKCFMKTEPEKMYSELYDDFKQIISTNNDISHYLACLIFSCLINFCSFELVKENFTRILEWTENQHPKLMKSAYDLVCSIILKFPNIIASEIDFNTIFDRIMRNPNSLIVYKVLNNLSQTYYAKQNLVQIFGFLMSQINKKESLEVIISLIESYPLTTQLITPRVSEITQILNINEKEPEEIPYYSTLCSLLTAMFEHFDNPSNDILLEVLNCVVKNLEWEIDEDLITLLIVIHDHIYQTDTNIFTQIINYLKSLINSESPSLVAMAYQLIGDLFISNPDQMIPHLLEINGNFEKIINTKFDWKHDLPMILDSFADIISGIGLTGIEFIKKMLVPFSIMFKNVTENTKQDSEELSNICESLLRCFISIFSVTACPIEIAKDSIRLILEIFKLVEEKGFYNEVILKFSITVIILLDKLARNEVSLYLTHKSVKSLILNANQVDDWEIKSLSSDLYQSLFI